MGEILAWQHTTGHVGANEFLRRVGAAAGERTKGGKSLLHAQSIAWAERNGI